MTKLRSILISLAMMLPIAALAQSNGTQSFSSYVASLQRGTPNNNDLIPFVTATNTGFTTLSVTYVNLVDSVSSDLLSNNNTWTGTNNFTGPFQINGVAPSTTINGVDCLLGGSCSISAVASSLAIGTTTITGGTTGHILSDNAGVLGELPVTGTAGNVVLSNSPTLVTPALGTPSALTLTNATGLPISGLTGLGTGVSAALAAAVTGSGGIALATSPTIASPVINGTITGTGLTNYLASPPAIGGTTPSTGVFSGLGVNVNSTGGGILTIQESGAQQIKLNNATGTTEAFIGTIGATGSAPTNALRIRGDAGISLGTAGTQSVLINTSNIVLVSSGLANSLALSGSANNPSLSSTSGGAIAFPSSIVIGAGAGTAGAGSGANSQLNVTGTTTATAQFYASSGGTDQKTWDYGIGASGAAFRIRLLNDAFSAATLAYQINAGTTYNIASHLWNTSIVAGTVVQGLSLTPTAFTVGDGTHSSLIVNSPGANAFVNQITMQGGITGASPGIFFTGSDTNVSGTIAAKGAGALFVETGGGSRVQFAVIDNASGADYLQVNSSGSGGILSSNAGSILIIPSAGATFIQGGLTIGSSGAVGAASAHEEFHGTAPAVVAGTGATIAGNDSTGRVTVGTTPSTTVVLTFANAWNSAPICFAQDETSPVTMRMTSSTTTAVTFTSSIALAAANAVSYRCQSYN